jgi:uncharacterized protein YbjT (DUF2867 family)
MAQSSRIAVTGATGYLGQHIMAILGEDGIRIRRGEYELVRGWPVIHAGWATPKTMAEADEYPHDSVARTKELLAHGPSHIVFVSTLTGGSQYLEGKDDAENMVKAAGVPVRVVRLPGLFGYPKDYGIVWDNLRNGTPLPDPYDCLHVVLAARYLVAVMRKLVTP